MHDVFTVGIPVLAILFGILFNQRAVDRLEIQMGKLETRMDGRFNLLEGRIDRTQVEINGRLDRMQADLAHFYKDLGRMDNEIDHLKK